MNWKTIFAILFFACWQTLAFASSDLAILKRDERLADFRVDHLYSDAGGNIVGAKFIHTPTGAPVFLLQIETVPQVFTWIQSPIESNQGLPHALEHLLIAKGTKGRYLNLLEGMRLSDGGAATDRDFVYYGLFSGAGMDGFFEQFHALLDALYHPDFTDTEAEREFYHFAIANDEGAKKTLIESGTVYDEMLSSEDRYNYVFELSKRTFGEQSPFAFNSGGAPDEMRTVTPSEIRRFHNKYYRIGPGTGFIFSFPPQEDVALLLRRISDEFQQFAKPGADSSEPTHQEPKYQIHPSPNLEPGIFPYPSPNETSPGFIHFSWAPAKTDNLVDLKMLELFFQALAGGEGSFLHKAIVQRNTRTLDLGATGIDYEISFADSPFFPDPILEVSGISGNRISSASLDQLRILVLSKIKEVSNYKEHSRELTEFNKLIMSNAKGVRRSQSVWIKNPPGFDFSPPQKAWKEYLDKLEMDPSFIRSLSEAREWRSIDKKLMSGRNVWRELIQRFDLLQTPYVTATVPSPELLEDVEKRKQDRVKNEIRDLMARYHTSNEQEALLQFEREELVKTKEIDQIETKVSHPHFTDHPPMTPDDNLQYRQFLIDGVPTIASIFKQPPTIDIGISFDLRKVPQRYYKYLPLLLRTLDSLGLKNGEQVIPYSDLSRKIQENLFAFSTAYETSPVSKRADFTLRASATNVHEFRSALKLIEQLIQYNFLDSSNADRLRDIVQRNISDDAMYPSQDASITNSAYSFRYQHDLLYLALNSRFTDAHLDNRLKWLLHVPASPSEINELDIFAKNLLAATPGMPKKKFTAKLEALKVDGLERELVEYWKSSFADFSEMELTDGLRQLAMEVVEDLRIGPTKTIEDIKDLQRIVLNRRGLRLDLTSSKVALSEIDKDLKNFVSAIPDHAFEEAPELNNQENSSGPIIARLEKRYHLDQEHAPWYIGFVNPSHTGGDVHFSADLPGYSQVDRVSVIRVLASSLFSGAGPQSFQTRTAARGLAYRNGIFDYPALKRVWYYADRSPDVASLISFVNEIASTVSDLKDPDLIDYALGNTFTFSRTMFNFSERGKAVAQDIRDGNEPERIRHFSEEVLKLRKEPDLLLNLTSGGLTAICGVLVREDCREQQQSQDSLFFFGGSEQVLSDIEKRLPIPKLLRLYPYDFWIDFPGNADDIRPSLDK
jgi:Zn-dependent M16 (insulinase) family peptidase